ncbi:DegT/DnrJ/EryC1/StrS family aminotransferase [Alteromonas sp. a30]|uniref:DegT/DnrJ/EryC1/StrS family aminotransferase n=1 Tax=Alteromonas sp. a30 TaxID=2730917 RepID=UPI00227E9CE4|nr:DegT/DnrJ/EryC1/StrS family aminotransferase [Alteromonas sp. a30]MCY7294383.1 DegT/DnrJ/EryC1/StrS family aminotransferase [Alteromonas sp. a30]
MEFIDLKTQYQQNKLDIDKRIQTVLDHGKFIMGPEVAELEKKLADYVGTEFCAGVANGTDALQLALMALNIGKGDVVITTTFSFFATAEVISLVGATPVFVDICPTTYNMSAESLKQAITQLKQEGIKPKALIAVDLFGLPADYTHIETIAKENDIFVIEDAAQGFGGQIDNRKACSFGDIATTSFFPAKPLGCYGDGGAVFSNNAALMEIVESLRVHGKGNDKYDNVRIGMNSRLDTIQAAILLQKLRIFDNEVVAKQALAESYSAQLSERFIVPHVPENMKSSWAQYCLIPKMGNRQQYMNALKEKGVPSAIYYGKPLHSQSAYEGLQHYVDLSVSERISASIFSLPMHAYMSEEERQQVVDTLLNAS